MILMGTEKKYNGATLYIWKCEKCSNIVKTTNKGYEPKCKCSEIGKVYGSLFIKNMINNHEFVCYCQDCQKIVKMNLSSIKKYAKCPFCPEIKTLTKELLEERDIVGEIYGGLEVIEKDKNSKMYICRCECGNICKVDKQYLKSTPASKIIGCDECRANKQPMKYNLFKQLKVRYDIRFTLNDFTTFINKAVKNNQNVSYKKDKKLQSVFTLKDFILTNKEENENRQ